jgi:lipopolysaccharide/colanic/teichoic acid biosynthesis glycosyltransferase
MYLRFWKRVFDLTAAFFGLAILAVPLLVISALIKATSPGPVLFLQDRIGQAGKRFRVVKFRTMSHGHQDPSSITVAGDIRLTPWGKILRRWKLDEIPQLWNVLVGEMSLVGPRPDVPGYADRLQGNDRRILSLRPGITGPSSLKYADEEELLAQAHDPVRLNDEVIFPDKVRLNIKYLETCSFRGDLFYIWQTVLLAIKAKGTEVKIFSRF